MEVGNAQIATPDAEAALCRAAAQRTPDGPRQVKNGLAAGIKNARPISPHLQARIDHITEALDARVSVEEARDISTKAVNDFFDRAAEHWALETEAEKDETQGALAALNVSTGVGKTEAVTQALGRVLPDGGAIVIAVPMHRLSDEMAARIRKAEPGLSVAIRRGADMKARKPGRNDVPEPRRVRRAPQANL